MHKPSYQKRFHIIIVILNVFLIIVFFSMFSAYTIRRYKKIDIRIEGDWIIETDKLIGFTPTKSSSSVRRHFEKGLTYHIFTDNRGVRVNTSNQKTANNVAIMTIGGSYSWGHGVENEDTYTEMLGHKFKVPTANFALGSYGTVQSLLLLERNADLNPKVIIYGFITDHIRRNLSPCAPNLFPFCLATAYVDFDKQDNPYIHPPLIQNSVELSRKFYRVVVVETSILDDIFWGAKISWFQLTGNKKLTKNNVYPNDTVSRYKSIKFLINKMSTIANRIGTVLIIVHIPYLIRGQTNPAPPELLDSINKDIIFINLAPIVAQYYSNPGNPLLYFEHDYHPNALAHELIAREIESVLKRENIF